MHVRTVPILLSAVGLVLALPACGPPEQVTERVSVSSSETQANGYSDIPSISGTGQFVAFRSSATNLVNDTNGQPDAFVRDRGAGTTGSPTGSFTGDELGEPVVSSISDDGRYVAFSTRRQVVTADTNTVTDVYLRDRSTGAYSLVSVSSGGSQANEQSRLTALSGNGRYVAFWSLADNLVSGDTNGEADVFLRDLMTATTTRVSLTDSDTQAVTAPCEGDCGTGSVGADISDDGRYVAFFSFATNLVPGETANNNSDIYVRDRIAGTTRRVSVGSDGSPAFAPRGGAMSGDGRHVLFYYGAEPGCSDCFDQLYVRDHIAGTTELVSMSSSEEPGNSSSTSSDISDDGRYVVFASIATNLDANGSPGLYRRDRQTGTTRWIVSGADPSLSGDGQIVAYVSYASDLVPGDTNGEADIFVTDLDP